MPLEPFITERALPFCPKELTFYDTVPAGYDYIDLPETGGDKGLKEAMKWYWKFGGIEICDNALFNGVTTATEIFPWLYGFGSGGAGAQVAFPMIFDTLYSYDPANWRSDGFTWDGSMAGGNLVISETDESPQPKRKACEHPTGVGKICSLDLYSSFTSGTTLYQDFVSFEFFLGYDEATSRWRLLYKFFVGSEKNNTGGDSTFTLCNPANPLATGTLYATLTSPEGLTYELYEDPGNIDTITSAGVAPEVRFWAP